MCPLVLVINTFGNSLDISVSIVVTLYKCDSLCALTRGMPERARNVPSLNDSSETSENNRHMIVVV